ncbi:MAG: hypothetical protein HGA87_06120 [Desulfobulbaceae bacterium]|nr:hypothetical protein [Desulfobulbaceae bacterium]
MRLSIERVIAVASFLCLLIVGVFGCDFFPTQNKDGLPADHTDKKSYAYHVPLTEKDVVYCAQCHGSELKGGLSTLDRATTPSCYQCHENIWGFSGHTLLQTGPDGKAYHKEGLYNPIVNCTECHGQSLNGGNYNGLATPSCYKCHGANWDWRATHTLLKTGVDPQGYHVPTGIYEPQTNCARCHGTDLRGGTFNGSPTKSCYQCHNSAVWNWRATHTVRKDGKYHHPDYKRNPSMCQDCHGVRGQGGTARSCYGSGCHGGSSWPPDDDD